MLSEIRAYKRLSDGCSPRNVSKKEGKETWEEEAIPMGNQAHAYYGLKTAPL